MIELSVLKLQPTEGLQWRNLKFPLLPKYCTDRELSTAFCLLVSLLFVPKAWILLDMKICVCVWNKEAICQSPMTLYAFQQIKRNQISFPLDLRQFIPWEMKVLNPYSWKWARHQQLIFKNFSLSFMWYEAQIETAGQSRIVSILDGPIFEQEAIKHI